MLVTCSNKKYEWICNFKNGEDKIKIFMDNKIIYSKKFKKTRSSEFENEIKHIIRIKNIAERNKSNLNPKYAIDVINLIKKNCFKNANR